MQCPFCQTENRDDREVCYHCDKDLSMLRLIVNKAKHHYNKALEFAERDHIDDAIHELQNTLELDASMVSAHVVLGTLYAKKEMFAEARKCWHRALEQNHRFKKAHLYLKKAEDAEYVFPAMRRLKVISAALLVLLIAAVVGLGFYTVPDQGTEVLAQATEYLQKDPPQTRQAMQTLDKLADRTLVSTRSRRIAEIIQANIRTRWDQQLELAELALEAGAPAFTFRILSHLQQERPGPQTQRRLTQLRGEARRQMFERIHRASERYYENEVAYSEFKEMAETFLEAIDRGEAREEVTKLMEKIEQDHRQEVLARASVTITEAPTAAKALMEVVELESRYPELSERLREMLRTRLQAETSELRDQLDQLIEAGQYDQAEARIHSMEMVYQSITADMPTEQLEAMRRKVQQARVLKLVEQIDRAFRDEAWMRVIELTDTLERKDLPKDERVRVEGLRKTALERMAVQMWEWFHERDPKFEDGRISTQEALKAVGWYQRVIENLPERLQYARGPILFYAASAYFKLGQVQRTVRLLDQVRRDHPKSYVMRSVRIFGEKFEEELSAAREEMAAEETASTVTEAGPTSPTLRRSGATTPTESARPAVPSSAESPTTPTRRTADPPSPARAPESD